MLSQAIRCLRYRGNSNVDIGGMHDKQRIASVIVAAPGVPVVNHALHRLGVRVEHVRCAMLMQDRQRACGIAIANVVLEILQPLMRRAVDLDQLRDGNTVERQQLR